MYRQLLPIYFRIAFSELDAFCKFCPLDKILWGTNFTPIARRSQADSRNFYSFQVWEV